MSLPSEAEIRDAIAKRIKLSNEALKFAISNATNWVAMEESYLAAVDPDSMPGAQSGMASTRATLATLLDPGVLRRDLAPLWLTYARVKTWTETSDVAIIARLFETFALTGTPVTVKNRAWTYGNPADVGTPVGSGTLYRCTTDRFGYRSEAPLVADDKTVRCVADESSGRPRHQERFLVRGEAFGKDVLDIIGTGYVGYVDALSSENPTAQLVQNPSFEQYQGTLATPTAITGWEVVGSIGDLEVVEDDGTGNTVFQDVPGAATSRSLKFKTNEKIQQRIADRRWNWNPDVPIHASIACFRQSSCDGNVTLALGNVSTVVALSAQSGWFEVALPVDDDAWFRQWNEDEALLSIELSSNTTGDLLVDSLVLGPYTNIGGTFLAIRGGQTPFRVDDEFSISDSCSETGIIQKWIARTYRLYLPHTSGSAVWTDPA